MKTVPAGGRVLDWSDGQVMRRARWGFRSKCCRSGKIWEQPAVMWVSKATTPYVAFSDDDSWWRPGALSRAADLFEREATLGLIAARILVGPQEKLDPLSHAMATSPLAGPPHSSDGSVVRRSAFLQAGGFEQRFGVGGEEQVLALDLLHAGMDVTQRA